MAQIGIMGGTFNPIHLGHIKLALTAYKELNLDKIWFMPSKTPPHKDNSTIVDQHYRVEMINLAIANYSFFELSDLELKREGITYTSQTLEYLSTEYTDDTFYFIIGSDSLYDLESWNRPHVLFKLAHFVVACRDDIGYKQLDEQCRYLRLKYGAIIDIIHMDKIDISSSFIREKYACNINFSDYNKYVDEKVDNYIILNDLYKK